MPKNPLYNSPSYHTWHGMKSRCYNISHSHYKWYGGKGITVCDKWLTFAGFYEDMGQRPFGMTLDRIDNSKGYYPENCKWSTKEEQLQNKIHGGPEKKTHCIHGHEFTPENTYTTHSRGRLERGCKTCILRRGKESKVRDFSLV